MYSVLIVDDEPLAIEGLQIFVDWESNGFRICGIYDNGEEALLAARHLLPDVIVTDIRMPEMDGLELIGKIKELKDNKTQFIVLSAYSEFTYAKRAMQLGVQHYMLKPVIEGEAERILSQIRAKLDLEREIEQQSHMSEQTSLPSMAVQQLKFVIQAIEDTDIQRAKREVDRIFHELNSHHPPSWFSLFIHTLILQCNKVIRDADVARTLHTSIEYDMNSSANDIASLHKSVMVYIEHVIHTLQSLSTHKTVSTLTEIDRYVVTHYRDALSIKDIASKFYLNPVYLGKAYHDKFGCSLIDRMHALRIKEACEKLKATNEPINAIAESVGYAHYHYFSRQFESRVGMKPVQYRSSMN